MLQELEAQVDKIVIKDSDLDFTPEQKNKRRNIRKRNEHLNQLACPNPQRVRKAIIHKYVKSTKPTMNIILSNNLTDHHDPVSKTASDEENEEKVKVSMESAARILRVADKTRGVNHSVQSHAKRETVISGVESESFYAKLESDTPQTNATSSSSYKKKSNRHKSKGGKVHLAVTNKSDDINQHNDEDKKFIEICRRTSTLYPKLKITEQQPPSSSVSPVVRQVVVEEDKNKIVNEISLVRRPRSAYVYNSGYNEDDEGGRKVGSFERSNWQSKHKLVVSVAKKTYR
jgi:hypothetical protein